LDEGPEDDLMKQTLECKNYLDGLRQEHMGILESLQGMKTDSPESRRKESQDLVNERISTVIASLKEVEAGVEESDVILSLQGHFFRIETERKKMKMEMKRIKGENEWLREELKDTESKLEETLCRLVELEEEKKHHDFMSQLQKLEKESPIKPVTPSKIPIGSFKSGNNNTDTRDSNILASSSLPPPASSKIPMLSNKFGSNYKKVQEKIEKAANERHERTTKLRSKRHKLSITPATSNSSLPGR